MIINPNVNAWRPPLPGIQWSPCHEKILYANPLLLTMFKKIHKQNAITFPVIEFWINKYVFIKITVLFIKIGAFFIIYTEIKNKKADLPPARAASVPCGRSALLLLIIFAVENKNKQTTKCCVVTNVVEVVVHFVVVCFFTAKKSVNNKQQHNKNRWYFC